MSAADSDKSKKNAATTHDVERTLRDRFGDDVISATKFRDQIAVTVQQAKPLAILEFLRNDEGYDTLVDLAGVDCADLDGREHDFELVYVLRSAERGHPTFRLHVAIVGRENPKVPSAAELWPSAAWPEREIAEMYGIGFKQHPDPRKLLLPDNFETHPMRREYPLAGEGEREKFPELGVPHAETE